MFFENFPGFGFRRGFGKENTSFNTQVDNKEFYDIIGVSQDANPDQIKKAYRDKVVKVHPDKKGGNVEEFKKLQAAYEILSSPEKRDLYDRYGIDGIDGIKEGGGVDPFEGLFGGLFGGRSRSTRNQLKKMKPTVKKMKVTLEEIFLGGMKNISFQRQRICKTCDGKGGKDAKKCTPCRGTGMVEKIMRMGPGFMSSTKSVCKDCQGEGMCFDKDSRCRDCQGEKSKREVKTLEVPIEIGAPSNHQIVFGGEGNEFPGTIAGDIIIQFELETHKRFERKGADLYYAKKISLYEALAGTAFYVEHLDGKKMLIATSPKDVLTPNVIKVIKGKGLPFYQDNMSHGNLYVNFQIQFPKSEELRNPEKLKKVLPIPKDLITKYDQKQVEFVKDFDEKRTNPNPCGGKGRYHEEYEDEGTGRGPGVQCAQQ